MEFRDHTIESAPEAARAILKATAGHAGFVPVAMARQAEAPLMLESFMRLQQTWRATSLDELSREVVAFVVAHEVGCELCDAFHAALLTQLGKTDLLREIRSGAPLSDARLEAVRRFTKAVLATRGEVGDDELARFAAAGFDARAALEVVLGVSIYLLSTYANRLVRAPVDAPLAQFAR
ncbi:carboxymuconolactone decarboxylase family protein [Sandaracinus amylolyticus]|uniref:carboxymuconolactone decarboxylase family protein n=1 Tax=Sandaracinus amylolyticus TaxID=927083 RepID=UPI001F488F5C|nr:carboxymuconolactone decarboxylase family protein [Sandaracinus amylolyticus]UJR86005.1 Hypothetical protein I5071_80860 [Sandaracinus amylolyticus]